MIRGFILSEFQDRKTKIIPFSSLLDDTKLYLDLKFRYLKESIFKINFSQSTLLILF